MWCGCVIINFKLDIVKENQISYVFLNLSMLVFLSINLFFNVNTSNSGSVMNICRRPKIFILCELLHSFPALFLCGKGLTSERCNNVTMLHCIFPLLHSWPQTIAPVICQSNCGAGWHSSCHWQIQKQNNDGDLVMGKIQRQDRRSNPTKAARCTPFSPQ